MQEPFVLMKSSTTDFNRALGSLDENLIGDSAKIYTKRYLRVNLNKFGNDAISLCLPYLIVEESKR